MKRALWLGLGVVLLSNAAALGGVWYNRSGEPEAQLLLSERELQRVQDGWLPDESDEVLRLQLSWQRPDYGWQVPWLDEAKLRELGFTPGVDWSALMRQPQREVWLVLELDGPAYRRQVEQARQALQAAELALRNSPENQALQRERDERSRRLLHEQQASRLVLVDVGLDAEELRQRWPDRQRQVVLAGRIEPYRQDGNIAYGASIELENDRLSVPYAYRELARGWARSYEQPEFKAQVEVAFGRRHEPWVLGIRQ